MSSQPLIPSLPDDVAVNCLARVPRHLHPTLSLISKPIKSLLSSPLLYITRSLAGSTQPQLYISLRLPSSPQWFTLLQKHNSQRTLVQIPNIPSVSLIGSASVALNHEIYVIGGSVNDVPTSRVWVLDCRANTWRHTPGMRVGREFAAAGVVEGRIYVIGGCVADTWGRSANWAEVYDVGEGRWEGVGSREVEVRDKWMHACAVMGGRIYAMADRKGVVYDPKEGRWDVPEKRLDLGWRGRACVIDDVLYCYDYLGKIRGYDPKERAWSEVKGIDALPRFLCGATMADFGGRLVVLWEGKAGDGKEVDICCAEITLERREGGGIWGRIEWSDTVFTVPKGSTILHCLSVTL